MNLDKDALIPITQCDHKKVSRAIYSWLDSIRDTCHYSLGNFNAPQPAAYAHQVEVRVLTLPLHSCNNADVFMGICYY